MPHFFAAFHQNNGVSIRWNTRIYLLDFQGNEADGECIGAVVGLNPGSAKQGAGTGWQALHMGKDQVLPSVLRIVSQAYQAAAKNPPPNAYVQILNLFYICDYNSTSAIKSLKSSKNPFVDPIENRLTRGLRFVWLAWGHFNDPVLDRLKKRVVLSAKRPLSPPFYYSRSRSAVIVSRTNPPIDHPKHPIGVPQLPIINHIKGLL